MKKRTAIELAIHRLLPPETVAEILGVAVGTLSVWASTGRYNLPFVRVGRKRMYRPEDVEAFIARRTAIHTGQTSAP